MAKYMERSRDECCKRFGSSEVLDHVLLLCMKELHVTIDLSPAHACPNARTRLFWSFSAPIRRIIMNFIGLARALYGWSC